MDKPFHFAQRVDATTIRGLKRVGSMLPVSCAHVYVIVIQPMEYMPINEIEVYSEEDGRHL